MAAGQEPARRHQAGPVRDEQDEEGHIHRVGHLADVLPTVPAMVHPEHHTDGHVGCHHDAMQIGMIFQQAGAAESSKE